MSLFNASAAHTTGSHVKVYNAPHFGSIYSNTMAEFLKVERRTKQARLFFLPRRRAFSF
jgi:hypothetical protein